MSEASFCFAYEFEVLEIYVNYKKLFIKNPIIRINTVFFKEIAIKNRSFYHEFTTFERALI